jgi:hypothetical protein
VYRPGLLMFVAALAVTLPGCGGTSGASHPSAASRPSATAAPGSAQAAACSSALSPWTQYIADTNDFAGWVGTVGPHSPIVALPLDAARTYRAEEATAGASKASADGFRQLDQACAAFARSHPGFDFRHIPTAPTLPGN